VDLAIDLHIHSALSPCAVDDMTPANIVQMSALKGLDAIAVADHNACFNLPAAAACAREAKILLLPGIEVTTAEEVHVLVYFEALDNALRFGQIIYDSLPDIANNEAFFGRQLIIDEEDNITGKAKKLLAQAAPFSINAIKEMAQEYGGLFIPAHINREASSILYNLGFIPPDLQLGTVEIRRNIPLPPGIEGRYKMISSSDAHSLGQILERTEFIKAKDKTVRSLLDALR
jgi:PHP family Zn ribbon phosphoesterase